MKLAVLMCCRRLRADITLRGASLARACTSRGTTGLAAFTGIP
jgi:hypothetical protein